MKPGSTVAGNTHDGILKWMGGGAFEGSIRLPESGKAEPKRKEVDMTTAKSTRTADKHQDSDVTYVVMVVGGAPIFVVEDFDHAASVCDALAAGAKASGFSAKYDVVEVKRWTV